MVTKSNSMQVKSQTSLDGVVRLVRDVNPSVSGVIGGSTSATGVTGVVTSVRTTSPLAAVTVTVNLSVAVVFSILALALITTNADMNKAMQRAMRVMAGTSELVLFAGASLCTGYAHGVMRCREHFTGSFHGLCQ